MTIEKTVEHGKVKLGLGSYAYRWAIGIKDQHPETPLSPIGLVDKAALYGFELLQIADNMSLLQLTDQDLEVLVAHAQAKQVTLELGTDGISNDNALGYLEIAQKLNAKLVRVTLSHADIDLPEAELIRQLGAVVQRYENAGVSLALENHFLLSSQNLSSLIEAMDSPALGICLDVANSIASHEWPETTIENLAPYTLNLHLKDYRIQIDPYGVGFKVIGVPIGEGQFDIQSVFDKLVQNKRSVNVILEHWLPHEVIQQEGLAAEDAWTQKSIVAAKPFIDKYNNSSF